MHTVMTDTDIYRDKNASSEDPGASNSDVALVLASSMGLNGYSATALKNTSVGKNVAAPDAGNLDQETSINNLDQEERNTTTRRRVININTLDDLSKQSAISVDDGGSVMAHGDKKVDSHSDNHRIKVDVHNDLDRDTRRRGTASALIIAAAHKSGMTQSKTDRAKIDAILLRESANSEYMKQQRRRDDSVNAKIAQLKIKLERHKKEATTHNRRQRRSLWTQHSSAAAAAAPAGNKENTQHAVNVGVDIYSGDENGSISSDKADSSSWKTLLTQLADVKLAKWMAASTSSSTRHPSPSACIVVDMDSFFISCELLSKPHLLNVPCCVGSPHSIISTSNYKARQYGVRSAMGGWIAQTLVKELSNNTQTLVFLNSNFDLYQKKSAEVMAILTEYDPQLSCHSLDEAYMNLESYLHWRLRHLSHSEIQQKMLSQPFTEETTPIQVASAQEEDKGTHQPISASSILFDNDGLRRHVPLPYSTVDIHADESSDEDVVGQNSNTAFGYDYADDDGSYRNEQYISLTQAVIAEMRAKVQRKTGLTCSAGIGPNHMIAKIASDINKPNGQKYVPSEKSRTWEFLHPLPTRRVPGIGRVMEKTLDAFGISVVKDLYCERGLLPILFQPVSADFLLRASVGLNSSAITGGGDADEDDSGNSNGKQQYQRKGIGKSRTFAALTALDEILLKLQEIVTFLSHEMQQKQIRARTFTVTVKLHTFDVYNKAKSLDAGRFMNTPQEMTAMAIELFRDIRQSHYQQHQHIESDHRNAGSASTANGNVKKKTHSTDRKQASLFHVRLLGMRCNNLVFDTNDSSENNDIPRNQPTIQSFLTREKSAQKEAAGSTSNTSCSDKGTAHAQGSSSSSKPISRGFAVTTLQEKALSTRKRSFASFFQSQQQHQRSNSFCGSSKEKSSIPTETETTANMVVDTKLLRQPGQPSTDCFFQPVTGKRSHNDKDSLPPLAIAVRSPLKEEISAKTNDNDEKDREVYECPVCQLLLSFVNNNDDLNRHIDSCLNSSTVKQVVREEQEDYDSAYAYAASKSKTQKQQGKGKGRSSSPLMTTFFARHQYQPESKSKDGAYSRDGVSQNRIKTMKESGGRNTD
jgi:nucleotidyltransferase/DNA polymerase involved in DNA repair